MKMVLKNGNVYSNGSFRRQTVCISNGTVTCLGYAPEHDGFSVVDCSDFYIFPGFTDVHVHFREPGFSYKETIATGSKAAARGGFTDVCTMPNLVPCPESLDSLNKQIEIIKNDACINVHPFGTITKGQLGKELSDMADMAEYVIGFSDDGRGVQSDEMMEIAMENAKKYGKVISAHCEDNSLLNGGYIHDGKYAKIHGHRGICSESEWKQIERDLKLVEKTGCSYHVCHISTKESVALIREAKKNGLDVSCETAPHYLVMDDTMLEENGRFKMNPPIRDISDKDALVEGVIDGTIDMVATDHAPHSLEEKSRGLEKSMMGVVGIETSFPILYTNLVKKNIISLEKLVEVMCVNPSRRFGIEKGIGEGKIADLTIFNLDEKYIINPEDFLSKGRSTPFEGWEVYGECMMTVANGKLAWENSKLKYEKN